MRFLIHMAAVITLLLGTGCAVLTKSQIEETKTFAKAASTFSEPAQKPGSYLGSTERFNQLVGASARSVHSLDFGVPKKEPEKQEKVAQERFEKLWGAIHDANFTKKEYDAAVGELNAKIHVIETYSKALETAATADNSKDLSKSAEDFGKSLNKAIETHNKVTGSDKNLASVSGLTAGAVRGVGGLYLKHRQAKLVKDALSQGDLFFPKLTMGYSQLMTKEFPRYLEAMRTTLMQQSQALYVRNTSLDVHTIILIADRLNEIETAIKLSHSVGKSAIQLNEAHTSLRHALQERRALKEHLDAIQLLVEEVKEAQKLSKKLENQ